MFTRPIRTLFAALALSFGLLPASSSAAVIEFMSVTVKKAQEADGDEVRMSVSIDGGPAKTFGQATMLANSAPWILNRSVTYKSQVNVTMQEMDGTAATLVGSVKLRNDKGIFIAVFQGFSGAHYELTYRVIPNPSYYLELDRIKAVKTQGDSDNKTVVKIRADAGSTSSHTKAMANNTLWFFDMKKIPFKTKVTISLYDWDVVFDDFLASRDFSAADIDPSVRSVLLNGRGGTQYLIYYRVVMVK